MSRRCNPAAIDRVLASFGVSARPAEARLLADAIARGDRGTVERLVISYLPASASTRDFKWAVNALMPARNSRKAKRRRNHSTHPIDIEAGKLLRAGVPIEAADALIDPHPEARPPHYDLSLTRGGGMRTASPSDAVYTMARMVGGLKTAAAVADAAAGGVLKATRVPHLRLAVAANPRSRLRWRRGSTSGSWEASYGGGLFVIEPGGPPGKLVLLWYGPDDYWADPGVFASVQAAKAAAADVLRAGTGPIVGARKANPNNSATIQRLRVLAAGLDLSDAEDRSIYRQNVFDHLANCSLRGIKEYAIAAGNARPPNNRSGALRALANALIASMPAKRNPVGRWPSSTEIQSLLFDKRKWTPARVRAWTKSHGFASGKIDAGGGSAKFYRVRQHAPSSYMRERVRTITLSDTKGIKAIVGVPSRASGRQRRRA